MLMRLALATMVKSSTFSFKYNQCYFINSGGAFSKHPTTSNPLGRRALQNRTLEEPAAPADRTIECVLDDYGSVGDHQAF